MIFFFRESSEYITFYVLVLNSTLNILLPGVTLIFLNISIMKKIWTHVKNIEKFLNNQDERENQAFQNSIKQVTLCTVFQPSSLLTIYQYCDNWIKQL